MENTISTIEDDRINHHHENGKQPKQSCEGFGWFELYHKLVQAEHGDQPKQKVNKQVGEEFKQKKLQ